MAIGLVGSEMCIRDSDGTRHPRRGSKVYLREGEFRVDMASTPDRRAVEARKQRPLHPSSEESP